MDIHQLRFSVSWENYMKICPSCLIQVYVVDLCHMITAIECNIKVQECLTSVTVYLSDIMYKY
jgi:hypothetical protein